MSTHLLTSKLLESLPTSPSPDFINDPGQRLVSKYMKNMCIDRFRKMDQDLKTLSSKVRLKVDNRDFLVSLRTSSFEGQFWTNIQRRDCENLALEADKESREGALLFMFMNTDPNEDILFCIITIKDFLDALTKNNIPDDSLLFKLKQDTGKNEWLGGYGPDKILHGMAIDIRNLNLGKRSVKFLIRSVYLRSSAGMMINLIRVTVGKRNQLPNPKMMTMIGISCSKKCNLDSNRRDKLFCKDHLVLEKPLRP